MITEERLHRVMLPVYVTERISLHRDSPHAFDRIDPAHAALIVIDLQNGFMAPGQPADMQSATSRPTSSHCRGSAATVAVAHRCAEPENRGHRQ